MNNWDEVRTAYQVARMGTVSGAAEVLGVHHATVIRHIDALEGQLGAKLFQRHARGYTPTDAGRALLDVAQATEEKFAHLAARIAGAGDEVAGELVVTSVPSLSPLVTPTLVRLGQANPGLRVRYLTDLRLFRLEHGEAHVAVRAGAKPQDSDYVVQPLVSHRIGLYASPSYVQQNGRPDDDAALAGHRFVGLENLDSHAPFHRWLMDHVPRTALVFRTNDPEALTEAVAAGAGIGFVPVLAAEGRSDLVQIMPSRPEWDVPLWLVTHVDLHRSSKVQAFLAVLKDAAKACTGKQP